MVNGVDVRQNPCWQERIHRQLLSPIRAVDQTLLDQGRQSVFIGIPVMQPVISVAARKPDVPCKAAREKVPGALVKAGNIRQLSSSTSLPTAIWAKLVKTRDLLRWECHKRPSVERKANWRESEKKPSGGNCPGRIAGDVF